MAHSSSLKPYLQVPLFGKKTIAKKLISLFGASSVVALWPLNETSGSTAYDVSGNGRNGAYTGVTLADAAGPKGGSAPLFDGANDYVNLYSTSLRDAFNGAEGSFLLWYKLYNSGVWTDGAGRYFYNFAADGSNYIRLSKTSATGQVDVRYNAGGTLKFVQPSGQLRNRVDASYPNLEQIR